MRYVFYHIALLLLFVSCDEKKNEVEPDYGFTKVIGSNNFEGEFYPWDVKQTGDGGYLIMAPSNSSERKDIYLLKLDQNGDFEWELNDTSVFKNPLPMLIENNGGYYLFAMHSLSLNTHLLQVDLSEKALVDTRTYTDFFNPTAVNEVPNGYLVQCFDRDARRNRLMKLNNNFNEQWRNDYAVNENPPEFDDHLFQQDPLPFFCGYTGTSAGATGYFLGGMRNYRLSTMFVNVGDGDFRHEIYGFRYISGVSNLMHMAGDSYFMVKYNAVGEMTVHPFITIDDAVLPENTDAQNETYFPEKLDYELPNKVRTVLKKMKVNGSTMAVMATETKSNQMMINFYEPGSGKLKGSKRVGIGNPYLLGNVISTDDGGLFVLSKTYVSGRFSRIAVTKIPAEEVAELF